MGRALRFANTWCRPNSSKWFIKNVLRSTINQPTSDSPNRALAMVGSESCQMIVGIGRHCQYSKSSVQTGEEHVRATLNRGWNLLGPPLLERLSAHQHVLQRK